MAEVLPVLLVTQLEEGAAKGMGMAARLACKGPTEAAATATAAAEASCATSEGLAARSDLGLRSRRHYR